MLAVMTLILVIPQTIALARAGFLALGLLALGSHRGARLLAHSARPLAATFAAWHLAAYAATAVAPLAAVPQLAAAAGLLAFVPPPPAALPLAAQLLVCVALAGLARGRWYPPAATGIVDVL